MSSPRYGWWGYVKSMIRKYPERRERLAQLKEPGAVTLSGTPGGKNQVSRPTESAALRELPTPEQREYEAVHKAIAQIGKRPNGPEVIKLIKLVYWDRCCTLYGASLRLHCSEVTAKRWHRNFVRKVAENYGLLRKDDTAEPK